MPGEELIFPSAVITPPDPQDLTKHVKALVGRTGLPDTPFQHPRHFSATVHLAQGVSLGVVKRMLRHSQVSLRTNTYVHIFPEVQKQVADAKGRLATAAYVRAV